GRLSSAKSRSAQSVKARGTDVDAELTAQAVASALRHDVNHTAGSTAVFRFETATFDLDFLNHLEGQVAVGIEGTGTDVGNFLSVDDKCIFRTAGAVDLELTRTRFRASCRRHLQDPREVRSFRKELGELGGNVG